MIEGPLKRIGELLIEQQLISPVILQKALDLQQEMKQPLGQILVKMGYISQDELNGVLAKQFGSIYINPKTFSINDRNLLKIFPEATARKYNCFPFEKTNEELTVVMEDPLNSEAIIEISHITGCQIRPIHAKYEAILTVLNNLYGKVPPPQILTLSTQGSGQESKIPDNPIANESLPGNALTEKSIVSAIPEKRTPDPVESKIERPWASSDPQKSVTTQRREEYTKPENKFPLPYLNFENFVVGPSNQLAWAAAQNVVSHPGVGFNPLFIYGGVGLGKTHLGNAIGNAILEKYTKAKVTYISVDIFVRELIESMEHGELKSFQNHYRSLDTLIIDDIQFLSGQDRTQEEFFYIFEQLYRSNGQMVMTSDRLPRQIDKLEDRLRSRFESGLLVDIQVPDLETRIAIFHKKAHARGLEISDDIARLVATRLPANIRELDGIANRILAQSQLMRESITLEMVTQILDTVAPMDLANKQPLAPVVTRPGVLPSQGFR